MSKTLETAITLKDAAKITLYARNFSIPSWTPVKRHPDDPDSDRFHNENGLKRTYLAELFVELGTDVLPLREIFGVRSGETTSYERELWLPKRYRELDACSANDIEGWSKLACVIAKDIRLVWVEGGDPQHGYHTADLGSNGSIIEHEEPECVAWGMIA